MSAEFLFRAPYTKIALLRSQSKQNAKTQGIKLSAAQNQIAEELCQCSWATMMKRHVVKLSDDGYLHLPDPCDWIALDTETLELFLDFGSELPGEVTLDIKLQRGALGELRFVLGVSLLTYLPPHPQFSITLTTEDLASLKCLMQSQLSGFEAHCATVQIFAPHIMAHFSAPSPQEVIDAYNIFCLLETDNPYAGDSLLADMRDLVDSDGHPYIVRLANHYLRTAPTPYAAILASGGLILTKKIEALLRVGISIGEDTLGMTLEECPEDDTWGILGTRDIMRCYQLLGQQKEQAGDIQGAIDVYRFLLRKNPEDNQGIRSLLSKILAREGRLEELHEILLPYEDHWDATVVFGLASTEFLSKGNTERARQLRDRAQKYNPFILAAMRKSSDADPVFDLPTYAIGSESEAEYIAFVFHALWKSSPSLQVWWG